MFGKRAVWNERNRLKIEDDDESCKIMTLRHTKYNGSVAEKENLTNNMFGLCLLCVNGTNIFCLSGILITYPI